MNPWRAYYRIGLLFRSLFRRKQIERELDDEFQFYLDQRIEYELARGVPAEEARSIALRALDGMEQQKEQCRDMRATQLIEQIVRDVRYGVRSLRRSPGFTAVAVLSLTLGIGANTAIFTLVDQIVLRLLPVKNPRELVQLRLEGGRFGSQSGDGQHTFSHPAFLALRDGNAVFSGLTGQVVQTASLAGRDRSELINAGLVAGNFFEVLGVEAHLGRLLTTDDDVKKNGNPVAVLQYDFWKNYSGGNRHWIGSTIRLNGTAFTVIGVSAPGFEGTNPGVPAQIWVPVTMKPAMNPARDDLENERSAWFYLFGRLRSGISLEQAEASLRVLYRQRQHEELHGEFFQKHPEDRDPFLRQSLTLIPAGRGMSNLRSNFGGPLLLLQALVGLVLLIACSNVAGLLMARAASRQREVAIRGALGASRGQLIGQFLVESATLAVCGGVAGVLASSWMARALVHLLPYDPANLSLATSPDSRVLLFSATISLVTALLFGLMPALRAAHVSPGTTMKEEAGAILGGLGNVRWRKTFVGVQVGLSCLLLIGAGLFARTFYNLKQVRLGFDTENVVVFSARPSITYTAAHKIQLVRSLIESLGGLPRVQSAGANRELLLTGGIWDGNISMVGLRSTAGNPPSSHLNAVTPGYFEALGIPIVAGRAFTWNDWGGGRKYCLVNQALVDEYIEGGNALGRYLGLGRNIAADREIKGVVANTHYEDVRGKVPRQVFLSLDSMPAAMNSINVFVRVEGDPRVVMPLLREQANRIDPNLVISGMRTMNDQLNIRLSTERLLSSLTIGFALVASVLSIVGLYGVLSFLVARRTREIGIRMALGAGRVRVVRMVIGEMLTAVLAGMAGGLLGGVLFGRVVESQLFGVPATDPLVFGGSAVSLLAVTLVATFIPAWKAVRIEPTQALRND